MTPRIRRGHEGSKWQNCSILGGVLLDLHVILPFVSTSILQFCVFVCPNLQKEKRCFQKLLICQPCTAVKFKMDLPQWCLMPELLERAKRKPNHIFVRDYAADIKGTAA